MQKEGQDTESPLQVTEITAIIETKKFVREFGVETLLEIFDEFRNSVSCKDYRMLRKIKEASCEVFEVNPKSVFVIRKGDYVVAKKVIAYLLKHYTKFNQVKIGQIIGMNAPNTSHAINTVDHYINNQSQFREICEKIDMVEQRITLPKELTKLKIG